MAQSSTPQEYAGAGSNGYTVRTDGSLGGLLSGKDLAPDYRLMPARLSVVDAVCGPGLDTAIGEAREVGQPSEAYENPIDGTA